MTTPLEVLDQAVSEGRARPVTPEADRLCGKTVIRFRGHTGYPCRIREMLRRLQEAT